MNRIYVISTVLLSIALSVKCYDEIDIFKVKYRGTPQKIAEFRQYKKTVEECDYYKKLYKEKKVLKQEYFAKAKGYHNAYVKLRFHTYELEVVPTIYDCKTSSLKREEKWQLYEDEGRAVRRKLDHLKKMIKDRSLLQEKLKKMLPRFKNHPGEGQILLILGDLNKDSFNIAKIYYEEVNKCKFRSDMFGFTQQRAWQNLAKLYEVNKQYGKAIESLKKWKICEPCGNGAASSRIKKYFWIARLSMQLKNTQEVRSEMWTHFLERKIDTCIASPRYTAEQILLLYQNDLPALFEDSTQVSNKIKKIPNNLLTDSNRKNMLKVIDHLKDYSKKENVICNGLSADMVFEVKSYENSTVFHVIHPILKLRNVSELPIKLLWSIDNSGTFDVKPSGISKKTVSSRPFKIKTIIINPRKTVKLDAHYDRFLFRAVNNIYIFNVKSFRRDLQPGIYQIDYKFATDYGTIKKMLDNNKIKADPKSFWSGKFVFKNLKMRLK